MGTKTGPELAQKSFISIILLLSSRNQRALGQQIRQLGNYLKMAESELESLVLPPIEEKSPPGRPAKKYLAGWGYTHDVKAANETMTLSEISKIVNHSPPAIAAKMSRHKMGIAQYMIQENKTTPGSYGPPDESEAIPFTVFRDNPNEAE